MEQKYKQIRTRSSRGYKVRTHAPILTEPEKRRREVRVMQVFFLVIQRQASTKNQ
jgi:hypothetical protein